jgi:putative DNA primase/helicase
MVLSIEVEEGKTLAEGLVKSLTGGDTVSARHLYQEFVEFRPEFKLWLVCNDKPKVRHSDDAIWRRILVLPMDNKPAKKDVSLKNVLREDPRAKAAILAWAVQGCKMWQEQGLLIAAAAEKASAAYREDMDPLKDFLAERCRMLPGRRDIFVPITDLRAAYENWAYGIGQKCLLGPANFNDLLEGRGLVRAPRSVAGKVTKVWEGIEVFSGEEPEFDVLA